MEEQNNNVVVEKKSNGFAITGLVCSIVVGGLTGLIFSIIGLCKVKKCNSGKGLAIAGLIISIIKLVFTILIIILFALISQTDAYQEGFNESFCESMSSEMDECTKLEDGTYDCIYAICDFDNVGITEDNDDTEETEIEMNLSVSEQIDIIMSFMSIKYDDIKFNNLTNDDLLYLIYALYGFDTISADDMKDLVFNHFSMNIELKDGYNPLTNELAIEYDETTDSFTYVEEGHGFAITTRYEYEISRMEEDGMLIINNAAVYYIASDVGPVAKIYSDKELVNEIAVDTKYFNEDGSVNVDSYMYDHYDTLSQYSYYFELNNNIVNFISVEKIK